jgi:2-polyprenyl-3-methyl-5-hydroxy-6-metoxy-1,4-benzoquinol methylase
MPVVDGRQQAPKLSGIREDHVNRYRMAVQLADEVGAKTITDLGSGIGYGSHMLAEAGHNVIAMERDWDAIDYGRQHYSHPNLDYLQCDVTRVPVPDSDMLVAFEILEHVLNAAHIIQGAASKCGWLICSVPNENVVPFSETKHPEHVRHYTPEQFTGMLESCGWEVIRMGSQIGKYEYSSEVSFEILHGRTLVAVAKAK